MITIYNKQGTAIVTVPSNGTKRRTLMGENNIKLEFEHIDYFDFMPGCYVVYEYSDEPLQIERFDIISSTIPEVCKNGFKYSLTFEAAEAHLKRVNMFYEENDSSEVAFCLYDDIDTFGNLIVKCANKYINTITWAYGGCNVEMEGVKAISFKGDKLYEAFTMVAEAFDCEWWTVSNCGYNAVSGAIEVHVDICFGKLQKGSEVDFEIDKTVSSMQRQGGDNSNYGTRFFCFGSTKNLTSDYGQSAIKSGVSEIRLHLPEGVPYIDIKEGLTDEEIIHQTVFFDDIYPKNTDTVTAVETEESGVEGSNQKYNIYFVTAADTPFLPSNIIKGQPLMMEFTSGQLQGQEFEVHIKDNTDNFDKKFEIVAQQTQGDDEIFFIPNDAIKPVVEDTFILKNITLPKARAQEAEQELLTEGRKWAIKNSTDTDVYNCPTNPVYCTQNDLAFELGQKVRLKNRRFTDGGRSSRIMGYEKNLGSKYVGSYTVGDNTTYSHIGKMESDIKAAQYTERVGVDAGGTYIITKYDNTTPSDSNLYSALKTMLTFAKLVGGNLFRGMQSFYDGLRSSDFVTGLTGRGFQIKKDEQGKWREEIDSLTVREFLEVPELRFNRVDVVSGELWNATAFGTIESVDTVNKIATVKLVDGEMLSLHVNDICRGIFHSLGCDKDSVDDNGFGQMKGFGTVYFTPKEILSDGKSFRYELQSGSTFHPCKAMKFVAYGNFSDVTRQASAYHTKTYTRYLEKVNTWSINPDKNIVAQYGDIDGLTIGGVTMKGTGSFQKNSYLSGVQIQFTPEQKEDLKGNDAYSVSLSSYEGVIKISGDGAITNIQQEYNVISDESNVVSGDSNLITTSYALSTRIQAFKGAEELTFDVTPSKGSYIVGMKNVNCSALMSSGVLYILSVEDKESAYVDLTVNCEGHAIFNKRYSVVVLTDGKDADNYQYIYTRTTSYTEPSTPPTSQEDKHVPKDWTDDETGVDETYRYEWISKRVKTNGVWSDYSKPALRSKYATDGVSYSLIPSVTQIGCNSLGSYEPSAFSVSLYSKTGDGGMLPYDASIVVWGYNGSRWVEHRNANGSSISVGSLGSYKQYCIKAYTALNPSFDAESIATVSVNVVTDGANGENGEDGENFASGSMPRNCGEYNSARIEPYVYDKDFRDIVWIRSGAESKVYQVAVFGKSPTGSPPDNGWMEGSKSTFMAIDTALVDGADIAGFLFKDGVMQSRDSTGGIANTIINGKTGEIITRKLTAINADISGTITATNGAIGGFNIVNNSLQLIEEDTYNISINAKENIIGTDDQKYSVPLYVKQRKYIDSGRETALLSQCNTAILADGDVAIMGKLLMYKHGETFGSGDSRSRIQAPTLGRRYIGRCEKINNSFVIRSNTINLNNYNPIPSAPEVVNNSLIRVKFPSVNSSDSNRQPFVQVTAMTRWDWLNQMAMLVGVGQDYFEVIIIDRGNGNIIKAGDSNNLGFYFEIDIDY